MTWLDTLRTATDAVRTHRLRSALTMLGILIGITAVVLTVGLGDGARADVQDQINQLGTNVLVVSPGSTTNTSSNVPKNLTIVAIPNPTTGKPPGTLSITGGCWSARAGRTPSRPSHRATRNDS